MHESEIISQSNKLLAQIQKCLSLSELEELQIKIIGRKGIVNDWIRILTQLSDKARQKKFGRLINQTKNKLKQALLERKNSLFKVSLESFDLTLPGVRQKQGAVHPITTTIKEITDIFSKIGFYKVSYPEIEYEFFSFDSLNMPSTHPARDEFESFTVDGPSSTQYGRMVLSPHTSSGQVREMLRRKEPPIRMINIARCFRRNLDITHTPMFHQFEGLCIDENINIKHLKGAIAHFAREYFGYDVQIRLRPYHFQFTEPSFEIDTTCTICRGEMKVNGEKCRVCKSGWLELGGAGMVHPNVLKAGKIDFDKYTGWAFGFGVERVYMMKYQLSDLRVLFSGNLDYFLN